MPASIMEKPAHQRKSENAPSVLMETLGRYSDNYETDNRSNQKDLVASEKSKLLEMLIQRLKCIQKQNSVKRNDDKS